ncbi:MAG: phospho-sugar mutase, partial [Lachnospiraceae bacterium]|nr:phospho-sugar mutase [Lachnospiraceae bacterium]
MGEADFRKKYEKWLNSASHDDPMYDELVKLAGDENEMKERFLLDITFGTAGLRGKVHLGTNCMNFYTVGRATQGISEYIKEYGEEAMKRGVIIAHDPRH